MLEKERQGEVCYLPRDAPTFLYYPFLGYTKLLMRLPRFLISAVTLGKCPHLSEPQSLTWKLGMMIVLILQTLRTKYFQDQSPGVSKGGARSFMGSKLVAFWRSSQGKLYSIIWLSVKILWVANDRNLSYKQRQKWWEGCLISHTVKEKAERLEGWKLQHPQRQELKRNCFRMSEWLDSKLSRPSELLDYKSTGSTNCI